MRVSIFLIKVCGFTYHLVVGAGKTSKTWYLSTWSSNWTKAVEECKSYGMKLATFGSDKREAEDLLNLYSASNTHPDAFIGYTDEVKEGTFTTLRGEKLQINLNFHTNEPNNGRDVENCLEFYNLNMVVKYNDVDCSHNRNFICEFETNCQSSCDRVNKENTGLQNELSEVKLNLQRKDDFLNLEKLKHEQRVKNLQNELSGSISNLQSKDRLLNEANSNLQRKHGLLNDADKNLELKDKLLDEAEKHLEHKDNLLDFEKSKHEKIMNSLHNELSEAKLSLQCKDKLLDDADKNLKRKVSLMEVQKSMHNEAIEQFANEIKNLKQIILQKPIAEEDNLSQKY